MRQKVKVTIGLCVKNVASVVGDAVDSIVKQDYPHEALHVVAVDGRSTDDSVKIIEEKLKGKGITYGVFYESMGLGAARQIVVDKAVGDYIIWVDADMRLSNDFVRRQVEFMEKNQKAGISKGRYGNSENVSLVSLLENAEFVVDSFQYMGEITSNLALGTSGCIYRVEAIRQAKGFDVNIRGVGEDMDAERRMKESGWSLHISDAVFYEKRRSSWKSLWAEYFWHGVGGRFLFQKEKRSISLSKMMPPISLAIEVRRSAVAYRLIFRKVVFLLPIHWVFKRTAWLVGFVSSH